MTTPGAPTSIAPASSAAAPATTAAKAHVGSTITLTASAGGQSAKEGVTLVKVLDPATPSDSFLTAPAGKRLVGAELTIVNQSTTAGQGDANNDVSLVGSDNQTYTSTFATLATCTNFDHGSFDLAAGGGSATGCVTFEVPTGVTVAKADYKPGGGLAAGDVGEWLVP